MSASKLVTIMCDYPGCGMWIDRGVAETATRAREQLRGTGWLTGVPSAYAPPGDYGAGSRDYCTAHAKARLT